MMMMLLLLLLWWWWWWWWCTISCHPFGGLSLPCVAIDDSLFASPSLTHTHPACGLWCALIVGSCLMACVQLWLLLCAPHAIVAVMNASEPSITLPEDKVHVFEEEFVMHPHQVLLNPSSCLCFAAHPRVAGIMMYRLLCECVVCLLISHLYPCAPRHLRGSHGRQAV